MNIVVIHSPSGHAPEYLTSRYAVICKGVNECFRSLPTEHQLFTLMLQMACQSHYISKTYEIIKCCRYYPYQHSYKSIETSTGPVTRYGIWGESAWTSSSG